jgi:hypothetical protein
MIAPSHLTQGSARPALPGMRVYGFVLLALKRAAAGIMVAGIVVLLLAMAYVAFPARFGH